MAQPKLTMKHDDVKLAISQHIRNHYQELTILGREKPDTIHRVLVTIQDKEYIGVGKYNIAIDIYGNVSDGENGFKGNQHFTTTCVVDVKSSEDGTPIVEIDDKLILTKQFF